MIRPLVIAILAAACAACATVEVNLFQQVPSTRVDYAAIRDGADFSGFNAVLPGTVSVWTPSGGTAVDEAALAQLQLVYEDVLTEALSGDGAYAIAAGPGPGVLELQTQFINLRGIDDPVAVSALQRRYSFPLASDRGTLVVELVDANTGQVLAHIADVEDASTYEQALEGGANQAGVRPALARWAHALREFLDEAR